MNLTEIASFVEAFIAAECLAKQLERTPDVAAFNKQVDVVNAFLEEEMISVLGMDKLEGPKSTQYYEKIKKAQPITPRHLFRVELIEDKSTYFRAYVSDLSSDKSYFDCFIIQLKNASPLIISNYTFGYGRAGKEEKHWYLSGGAKINFDKAQIKETLRLQTAEEEKE